jgi:hypothetical protein
MPDLKSWILPGVAAASMLPAAWLKGQRQEDWAKGVGGFWSGVARAQEAKGREEEREALIEYYKERSKSLESERKAEEAKTLLESRLKEYRGTRSPSVGNLRAFPQLIQGTQTGGKVPLSPERIGNIQGAMSGAPFRPAPSAPSGPLEPSGMRPELFEKGTPMTGQEAAQAGKTVGVGVMERVRPDVFGKPKEKEEAQPNMTYGQALNQAEQDFKARYDPYGRGQWARSAELGATPEDRTKAREEWIRERAGEYMWGDIPAKPTKSVEATTVPPQMTEEEVAERLRKRLDNIGVGVESIDWEALRTDYPGLDMKRVKAYLER